MLYLIHDPHDSSLSFEFLEPSGSDVRCYSWFNLRTLDHDFDRDVGELQDVDLSHAMRDTDWQVIATFDSMPTATDLHSFLESSPELFI